MFKGKGEYIPSNCFAYFVMVYNMTWLGIRLCKSWKWSRSLKQGSVYQKLSEAMKIKSRKFERIRSKDSCWGWLFVVSFWIIICPLCDKNVWLASITPIECPWAKSARLLPSLCDAMTYSALFILVSSIGVTLKVCLKVITHCADILCKTQKLMKCHQAGFSVTVMLTLGEQYWNLFAETFQCTFLCCRF